METAIKFAGYLAQQQRSIDRLKRDEARAIPGWFDYTRVSGLSREMVEKLGRIRPSTLGQATRIAGVTPAAVALIQCFLEIQGARSYRVSRYFAFASKLRTRRPAKAGLLVYPGCPRSVCRI